MSQVLREVENAIESLALDAVVTRVTAPHAEELYKELLEVFVEGGDRRWWWESFKMESQSVAFEDGKGFEHLDEFVPNSKEILWFVVEDDELPFYPIFEASTENVKKIIGECFAFEYYLIPKNKRWLLCENHHNNVIGVGDEVVSAIVQNAM
ncbi:DUF6756 family protein [Neptunomonas sp. XY-337]|uniref:DUF6756 family protein n=1 Tax=Neptunomonas sp. XY-337 TaxID=2561897 RepID=UPI0010AAB6FF|nr:DUF6756 family protein [Neptunomonas sp. XY-337]